MAALEPDGQDALVLALARLVRSGSLLIATDFDGTLAPLVRDPLRARPIPSGARALRSLATRTPVAVISGRDLVNLAVQCPVPGALLLGSYGLEPWYQSRDGAGPPPASPSPELQLLAAELEQLTSAMAGVQVEPKTLGIAVHYRNAPDHRLAALRVRSVVRQMAAREGMEIVRGKLVLELRAARAGDKGTALALLLDHISPRGCLFAGDDLGDLPAMRELHRRGSQLELTLAICVLGPETPEAVALEADRSLAGPRQWAELLERVSSETEGES